MGDGERAKSKDSGKQDRKAGGNTAVRRNNGSRSCLVGHLTCTAHCEQRKAQRAQREKKKKKKKKRAKHTLRERRCEWERGREKRERDNAALWNDRGKKRALRGQRRERVRRRCVVCGRIDHTARKFGRRPRTRDGHRAPVQDAGHRRPGRRCGSRMYIVGGRGKRELVD